MNIPADLRYTKEHEWLKVEGSVAVVGVTDYAQGELGDVVFVDIDPNVKEVEFGKSFGTIEAVKTVSELYAPCSGAVVEINSKLADEPQVINSDPYGAGWIIKIQIKDQSEIGKLLNAEDYKKIIGQ